MSLTMSAVMKKPLSLSWGAKVASSDVIRSNATMVQHQWLMTQQHRKMHQTRAATAPFRRR